MADNVQVKSFASPNEIKNFEKAKVELVNLGGSMIAKMTYEPGWKWSAHVKPIVKTQLCQNHHFIYLISGTLHVRMADGRETELKPGSVSLIPPGHDAWVVGNEPVVGIDSHAMIDAKKAAMG